MNIGLEYIPLGFHQTMTFPQSQTAVEQSRRDNVHPELAGARKAQSLSSHVSNDVLQKSEHHNFKLNLYFPFSAKFGD